MKTGDRDLAGASVTEGVTAGEKVVVLSAQPVRDGAIVKIEPGQIQVAGKPTVETGGGAPVPPGQRGPGSPAQCIVRTQ